MSCRLSFICSSFFSRSFPPFICSPLVRMHLKRRHAWMYACVCRVCSSTQCSCAHSQFPTHFTIRFMCSVFKRIIPLFASIEIVHNCSVVHTAGGENESFYPPPESDLLMKDEQRKLKKKEGKICRQWWTPFHQPLNNRRTRRRLAFASFASFQRGSLKYRRLPLIPFWFMFICVNKQTKNERNSMQLKMFKFP